MSLSFHRFGICLDNVKDRKNNCTYKPYKPTKHTDNNLLSPDSQRLYTPGGQLLSFEYLKFKWLALSKIT